MKTFWWARAKGFKWMGPYKNQKRAWAAVLGPDSTPAPEACVWSTDHDLRLVGQMKEEERQEPPF